MGVAKGNIRTTLIVDGEQKYMLTMSRIKAQQTALRAEGRALASTYNSQTTAEEKLSDKARLLTKQIELQKAAVQKCKDELDEADKSTDKNTETISKAETKYNNAVAALNKLENELADVTQELKLQQSRVVQGAKEWEEYGSKVSAIGGKIESTGKKVSVLSAGTAALGYKALDAAIDYEAAFIGVKKTVDATDEQFAALYDSIIELSTEIPTTAADIASVAEVAGQLGIAEQDLLSFTKVMINLGNATNLSAEEAATALAKFANITQMSSKDYERLGSVIVELGNNCATTEADIVNMASKLASTGELTGLTQSQMMAIAATLNSLGIEAEAGGTAVSKLLKKMQVAVETNGKDLKQFAKVSNMSVKEFKQAWQDDAVGALAAFTTGLNDTTRNGKSAVALLDEMNIKDIRLSNTILSLATSNGELTKNVEMASKAWDENTALSKEAEQRYASMESKLQILKNVLTEVGIQFGEDMMPALEKGVDVVKELGEKFSNLTDKQRENIIKTAAIVVGAGPLITILGKTTSGVGALITTSAKLVGVIARMKLDDTTKGLAKLTKAVLDVKGATGDTAAEAAQLSKMFIKGGVWCLAFVAAAAAVTGLVIAYKSLINGSKDFQNTIKSIGDGIDDFKNKIHQADGSIDEIKNNLDFSERDGELKEQYASIQAEIVKIATAHADERSKLTKKEKERLQELLTQLDEITQKEMALFSETQDRIRSYLEGEENLSEEAAAEYISQITTCEQEAVANAKLICQAQIDALDKSGIAHDEEYERRKKSYVDDRDAAISEAHNKANANLDYLNEIMLQNAGGYEEMLTEFANYNSQMEAEEIRYQEDSKAANELGWGAVIVAEITHKKRQRDIREQFNNDFLKQNGESVANYLATVEETIEAGGKLSDKQILMCKQISDSYSTLPESAKKSFGDTIEAIKEKISKADILNAAKNLGGDFADGITAGINDSKEKIFKTVKDVAQRMLKTFQKEEDSHSPSKKTRKLAHDFDDGIIYGVADKKKDIVKCVEDVVDGMLTTVNTNKKLSVPISAESISAQYSAAVAGAVNTQQALYGNTYVNNSTATANNYYSSSGSSDIGNKIDSNFNSLISLLKAEFASNDGILTERQAGRVIKKCLKSVNM